MTMLFSITV